MAPPESTACPECSRELPDWSSLPSARTARCPACGAVLDLGSGENRTRGKAASEFASVFRIPLEATGNLLGLDWKVVGRVRYDWKDDGETGYNLEYLLFNEKEGYRWLSETYKGHFALGRPAEKHPERSLLSLSIPRHKQKIGKRDYLFYEKGAMKVSYLDGVLPFQAAPGDREKYAEAIAPPYIYTEQQSLDDKGKAVGTEYFLSEYIPERKVVKAFNIPKKARGVAPAQPYEDVPGGPVVKWTSFVLAVLLFVAGGYTCFTGKEIFRERVAFRHIKGGDFLTQPFTVKKAEETLEINVKTTLRNSWSVIGVGLVNEEGRKVIAADDKTIQFYSGYEGGEYWSEGSPRTSFYWRVKKPGRYRLLLSADESKVRGRPWIYIRVKEGVMVTRWFIILSLLWPTVGILLHGRRNRFERRRWAEVL